jgi:hypothetical protein
MLLREHFVFYHSYNAYALPRGETNIPASQLSSAAKPTVFDVIQRFILFSSFVMACLCISACSSTSDASLKMVKAAFDNPSKNIEVAVLKPNLSYLRVNIAGLDALMVKGYIDQDKNGAIDVWYSSDGSVMRIQKNRYLGSVGFDLNWVNVMVKDVPSFSFILSNDKKTQSNPYLQSMTPFFPVEQYFFSRSRTVMPSYLSMQDERMSVSVSDQTPKTIPKHLMASLKNKELVWLSEKPQIIRTLKNPTDTFAWYGFEKSSSGFKEVISQQCLTQDFCITWMSWPIQ